MGVEALEMDMILTSWGQEVVMWNILCRIAVRVQVLTSKKLPSRHTAAPSTAPINSPGVETARFKALFD